MSQTSHKRQKAGSIPATATNSPPLLMPRLMISEYVYGEGYEPTQSELQVRIRYRGNGFWSVNNGGHCYNIDKNWETEPKPSSRTEEFLARTRFNIVDAITLAKIAYNEMVTEHDRSNRLQESETNGNDSNGNDRD